MLDLTSIIQKLVVYTVTLQHASEAWIVRLGMVL